jgi:hypothetical protein
MPAPRVYLASPATHLTASATYGEAVQSNELQVCVARGRRTSRVGLNAGGERGRCRSGRHGVFRRWPGCRSADRRRAGADAMVQAGLWCLSERRMKGPTGRSRDQQARWNGRSAMAGRGVRRARAIGSGGRHASRVSWATRLFGVEPADPDEAALLATRTDAGLLGRAGCGRSGRRVIGGLAR